MNKYNNHDCVKYHVVLSYVSEDKQIGYQKTEISHADTKEAAVVDVLTRRMEEPYPLAGVAVYECVLAF